MFIRYLASINWAFTAVPPVSWPLVMTRVPIGYLLGEENRGLACMFTMMNEARPQGGCAGAWCVRGLPAESGCLCSRPSTRRCPYYRAPRCKAHAIDYEIHVRKPCAGWLTPKPLLWIWPIAGAQEDRPLQQSRIDLMIPVIKGWLSEVAQEVTSPGACRVHGGMGFVEETGAAQYLRDVRITPDL